MITVMKLLPKGHNASLNLLGDCGLKNYSGGLLMFRLDCRCAFEQSTSLLIAPGEVCTCVHKRLHGDGDISAWLADLWVNE